MATYIVLTSFTDQGIRNGKDSTKRADAVKELAKNSGLPRRSFTGPSEAMMSLQYSRHLTMRR